MDIRSFKSLLLIPRGLWFGLSLRICLLLLRVRPIENRQFTLGLLVPYDECNAFPNSYSCGYWYASGITVALRKINTDPNLLAGHSLNFIWNNTRCSELTAVEQQIYQLNAGVDAFIGPACHCKTAAINAAAFNKTIISYGCSSSVVDRKKLTPTYVRTLGVDEYLIPAIIKVLQTFQWQIIGIVFERIAKYIEIKDSLLDELDKHGFPDPHIIGIDPYQGMRDDTFVRKTFADIKGHAKILVFVTKVEISRPVVYYLREASLVYKDTVFIICQTDQISVSTYVQNPYNLFLDFDLGTPGVMTDNTTRRLKQHLDSVLMIAVRPPTGKEYQTFTSEVKSDISKPPFNSTKYLDWTQYEPQPPIFAASLYDAVMLYAIALNKTLALGHTPTGVDLVNRIKGTNFKSIQGFNMRINENGSALNNLTLYQIRDVESESKTFVPVGSFRESTENNSYNTSHADIRLELDANQIITWLGGGRGLKEIPKDRPKCGFNGESCRTLADKGDARTQIIIAGVTTAVCFVIVILLATCIRQYKLERELKSQLWKIRYIDLQSKQRRDSIQSHCSHSPSADDLHLNWSPDGSKLTTVSQYKGNWVTVAKFTTRNISLTRQVLLELKEMREIRHKNINPFIGACTEAPDICIVMNYCSRGSLQDVLENADVTIDHLFIASLVVDIVQGMAFLHSSEIKSHGNLKSSNCLIDSQWVLKITDYGLPTFRSKAMKNSSGNAIYYEDSLWVAPEILRMHPRPSRGTQKGDVYSFAIILQEFHTREGPYSANYEIEWKEIIERVKNGEVPPFRPIVSTFITGVIELRDLMKHCWAEEPDHRPDFHEIKKIVFKTLGNNGIKTNIVDNMMYMMEKYADNLEEVVHERTELLIEEQKKTEALLERMLPRPVAEQLKKGRAVEAETFKEVSIYFSDIVGFTSLSADSTPMQVVMMLNDLYSIFDNIIREYDVYKVETIGDAYMVVSGLPIRNGHMHASEISRMALHLVEAVKTDFVVKHKPGYKLKLRVGIHSGSVVAGVVGSAMPRYCLFGDTVNMASRMESTGEALRIHISSKTKQILDELGSFTVERRGEVEVKGKGKVVTYWLIKSSNWRSSIRMQKKLNGCITRSPRGSLSGRAGSTRRELKGKASPGPPRKLCLVDGNTGDNHGRDHHEIYLHENPLQMCNGSPPAPGRPQEQGETFELEHVTWNSSL